MKAVKIENICRCPLCQSDNVFLMSNALHRFQMRCLDCGNRTRWKKKIEAVVDWYNSRLAEIDNLPAKRQRGKIKKSSS